jgi:hypothetical protein
MPPTFRKVSGSATDELLTALPGGADVIPDESFRTPTGRALRRRHPELFTRTELVQERARIQQRLDEFVATVHAPDDD